jgi:uncharacterized protein
MLSPKDLEELGCPRRVIDHCIAVLNKALEIADKAQVKTDREVISEGALLHDIGRCRTNGVEHALVGAKIARGLGVREEVVRVIERHIGAGIPRDDAVELGLPPRDFIPESPEEKIVAYADNLTLGTRYLSFEESLGKFKNILGRGHPAINRLRALHEEVQGWVNKS